MDDSLETSPPRWQASLNQLRTGLRSVLSNLRRAVPFAAGVTAALAALLIYQQLFPAPPPLTTRDVDASIAAAMASATPPPAFSALVYQAIAPSLVLIQTADPGADANHGHSLGSGVIIKDTGEILTSLHVVEGANEIKVTFYDGSESTAQIEVAQPENDIAVLLPEQLPEVVVPAVMGNPRSMSIGDEAYAVGNPFGLYGSMSVGVISGFDRTFRSDENNRELTGLMQIDAAVNPGNSGGPLLNRYGQVIGIIVGIINPTGQEVFIGIGFAVPITTAAGAAGSPPY
jgi:S1-C subfamily serine protease